MANITRTYRVYYYVTKANSRDIFFKNVRATSQENAKKVAKLYHRGITITAARPITLKTK